MRALPFLIVAGPTASGKSALAMELARRYDGTIVNADSLQVYGDLRLLSARPTPDDEAAVPHLLYGDLDGAEVCSVGRWLDLAREAVLQVRRAGRLPILCGGTGLYLKAALKGIAPVPDISPEVRAEARALLETDGPEALHARLMDRDPGMAARLRSTDSQRLARAWEVLIGTGRSLADWWDAPAIVSPIEGRACVIVVDPPREDRRAACDARLEAMIEAGALAEVSALLDRGLDSTLPVMRAVGVPDLARYLRGQTPLGEAVEGAKAATRQYSKRQATWIRHQISADITVPTRLGETSSAQHPKRIVAKMDNFLQGFLLTASHRTI